MTFCGITCFFKEPVPLPYPPVLMRQFTPPPEGLRPPSPPSPEPEGSGGGIYGTPAGAPGTSASASGAGQLVLPDGGSSKQMPEQS